ncbi:MAG: peptide chain release factor 1 [Planctomycetota bacterium]|nr:MAG: peptide chain release factor 1 [Planctomycetota bacterium]
MSEILSLLQPTRNRFLDLNKKLEDPEISNDSNYLNFLKEHGRLLPMMSLYENLEKATNDILDNETLIKEESDPEIIELAQEEIPELKITQKKLEEQILGALLDSDVDSEKNAIVEIRAGVGGDESGIFAGDLFRMYSNYAIAKKWKIEVLDSSQAEQGGYKDITFLVTGKNVYQALLPEGGGHRVQRVPLTESMGRVHTSAVTVAVLPEVEEIEVDLNPADLRIDTYRASGAGGQHVNTTDSAVRITHVPTGMVAASQEEKSQIQNRIIAEKMLRSRIYDFEKNKKDAERGEMRKSMVGSGDRSERIRTYNFPQNRVTDHRANITLYHLDQIINGDMDELEEGIQVFLKAELLNNLKERVASDASKK